MKIPYIDSLAVCNPILKEKINHDLCDKIIKKFEAGTIKTEKLSNGLFAFRLNDTQRVISTIISENKENTLLVLELLPHHEYSKSPYLNNAIHLQEAIASKRYTIVATLQEFNTGEVKKDSLPKLGFVRHHETTLLLNRDQLAFLEDNEKRSIITVTGAAGSGKTLMAELLINQKQNHKILYVTQSENLVADVNEHCNKHGSADIKTFESLCENFLEGKALKVEAHFIRWAKKNTKKNHILDSFKVKGKLDANIARELYEDICKIHDSDGDNDLGKKSLHYDEGIIQALYPLYLKFLNENTSIDLSLHHYPDNNPLNQYDIILVDESQDFGRCQLQYIKHFLNNHGCIYFFIDTNQSLSSDFNLINQYIDKLESLPNGIKNYQLNTGYRTPKHVTDLLNKITALKRNIIRGRLSPDILIIESIQDDNPGNLYWLDLPMNNVENKNALETLQQESEKSIQIAFIVPCESVLKSANTLFPKGAIYTTETIKGLEFKKIVLVDFLTKKNSGLNTTQLDVDQSEPGKINFPKSTEQAKYSRFFNQLFVSASRTTDSLYFIHTEPDQISEKFNKLFNVDINPMSSEDPVLSDSTPEEIIQFIINNQYQLDLPKLVYYCEKVFEKTPSPMNDDLSQSFKSLKEMLSKRNTKKVDNKQQEILASLIKRVDLLVEKPQPLDLVSVDTHETIKISSSTPMTAPPQDKRLCPEDLINIDLLTIHEQQLEQTINDIGKNVLLSLLIMRKDLPEIFKNDHKNISSFAEKITEKSLNQQDKNGFSALYWLVKEEKLKPIFNKMTKDKTFVKKINQDNFEKIISTGWSPFLLLCLNNQNSSEYLKKYTKNCLELERLKETLSKIHTDSYVPLSIFSEIGDNKVINHLIDKGADINFLDKSGTSALLCAAGYGHLKVVEFLVDKGADINFYNLERTTALHVAAKEGHLTIVEFLVDKVADIDFTNNLGVTALHLATFRGHLTVVEFLVNKGAAINFSNNNGFTALHLAIEENQLEIIEFLLSREANIHATLHDGFTVLHIAACQGNLKPLQVMLSRGVDINLTDNHGNTALHIAAKKGHLEIIEFLVNKDIDIDTKNKHENTALHFAAEQGDLSIIEFLVNNGADVNTPDKFGATVLDIAKYQGHLKVVEFLTQQCQKSGEPAHLDQITQNVGSFSNKQSDTTVMSLHDNIFSTSIEPLHRGEPLNPRGL